MRSEHLALGFGDENDILEFEFTPKMDNLLRDAIKEGIFKDEMGVLTQVPNSQLATSCTGFQNGRR
jgi:hypothetical protein